jgi:hypothetical protein
LPSLPPTDASAVNAISQTNPLSEGQLLILENESLFNDAAGIVAFDLALAAFISGQFSPLQATGQFLYVAIGGILFGAIVGTLIVSLRTQLIKWGDDDPIIVTTLQLLTPLLIYFFAEELGFSGILAVVAAGIAHGVERDRLRLTSARMQIVLHQRLGNGQRDPVRLGFCFIGRDLAHRDQRRLVRKYLPAIEHHWPGHLPEQTGPADSVEPLSRPCAPHQAPAGAML